MEFEITGGMTREDVPSPMEGGALFAIPEGQPNRDGLRATIAGGSLAGAKFATFDVLLSGDRFVMFRFDLMAGDECICMERFSPLTECQTRICLPLSGDLGRVDSMTITVDRKTDPPASFCISPVTFAASEPPRLDDPMLPRGPLVDEMGQSTLHNWPTKTRCIDALLAHLRAEYDNAPAQQWPEHFSASGGWKERRVEATGFFRTHHDGQRWWLVDPEGYLFWSAGLDCVHPTIDHEAKVKTPLMNLTRAHALLPAPGDPLAEAFGTNPYHSREDTEFNYLKANSIRAFGVERWHEHWAAVAHAELRRLGFNTCADWSDEQAASDAGLPYVRPLELHFQFPDAGMLAGRLPDAFAPAFEEEAAAFAENALRKTVDDPALIGYFLHNEPAWWQTPDGILSQNPGSHGRRALSGFLRERYDTDTALAGAWEMDVSFKRIGDAEITEPLTGAARAAIEAFCTVLIERVCRTLVAACKRVDPNHLCLGVRWWSFPPLWALRAMGCFDVVSFNYYMPTVDMVSYGSDAREPGVEQILESLNRPFLIGEWHFGALDGGLPSAGLYRVRDQEHRGVAYRRYVEQAAALPWCVGAHWFNLYDRLAVYSTTSSENYNIGFLDVCHRRHEPICRAARETHERLYAVAAGDIAPYDEMPDYLFPSR